MKDKKIVKIQDELYFYRQQATSIMGSGYSLKRLDGLHAHEERLEYLKKQYPRFYFVSSTTKVLTKFEQLVDELKRDDFLYVVPDFRLNKVQQLENLLQKDKDKVEFLCNECCFIGCLERKKCYETVSRQNLGEDC